MSQISSAELGEYLGFAQEVAREAGALTLTHFRTGVTVDTKADSSPVTTADRESETLIRRRIAERYPGHAILGEEHGVTAGTEDLTWVVDPIDGTKSFVHGVPLYAVLIALLTGRHDGREEIDTSQVVAGVLYVPPLNEMVSAARGFGCEWDVDGSVSPARVSQAASLSQARITTSDFADLARREPVIHDRVRSSGAMTRTWGDAFGYLLVATGRCEAMIDPIVNPWDIAPMPVLIEEAGGTFLSIDGRPVISRTAIATNGRLHHALIPPH